MRELLPVVIMALIMAWMSERRSIKDRMNGIYIRKEKFFYITMTVMLAVFVGLRTWYNDTITYIHIYELMEIKESIWETVNFSIGENPGFMLLNVIMRKHNVLTQNYFMIYAFITICIYLWFIRKYTNNILLSYYFFITMGCYVFCMAAVKQCVSVAFCLIAVDRFLQNRKISFVLWVLIAATFHPYALMYLIIPFLTFNPWTGRTYLMFIVFGIAGFCLNRLLGTVISITSMMGETYDAESFTGEGVNIFRLMVVWAPVLVSFLGRKKISHNNDKVSNLMMNLSMLNAEIMFVALFGTANYFARLANYFLIFQTIALPWLFRYFTRRSKQYFICLTIICYLLYFYYSNVISQPFDEQFSRISLFQYFQLMF